MPRAERWKYCRMFQDDDNDDDDDEEIPLDMEEVEAASKKARQDEDIHSEHVQVRTHRNKRRLELTNWTKHDCISQDTVTMGQSLVVVQVVTPWTTYPNVGS